MRKEMDDARSRLMWDDSEDAEITTRYARAVLSTPFRRNRRLPRATHPRRELLCQSLTGTFF